MTVTLEEAREQLESLVEAAANGGEVIITRGAQPIARIVPEKPKGKPRFGSAKGSIWMAPDFDETPEDFKDYL